MKYSLFTTMIHNGGTNTKNRPRKGAGNGNPSEDKPQCRIVRIGGRKLRNKKSIERHLKGIKAGDRVVLQYVGNYCDYDWAAVSANPDGEHLPAVNFGQFRELYNYAIRQIQTLGATAALLTLPALLPQRYFDHICRNLNRSHILHWVGDDVCRFNRWREEYKQLRTGRDSRVSGRMEPETSLTRRRRETTRLAEIIRMREKHLV